MVTASFGIQLMCVGNLAGSEVTNLKVKVTRNDV